MRGALATVMLGLAVFAWPGLAVCQTCGAEGESSAVQGQACADSALRNGSTGQTPDSQSALRSSDRRLIGTQQLAMLRGQAMGMPWSVTISAAIGTDLDALRAGVAGQLDAVDRQMSTWRSDSDLSVFNRAPPGSWHTLPPALFTVLKHALKVARASDGAFDPTVGPLVDLWGFGPSVRPHAPPSQAAIAAARKRVGWWRITLEPTTQRALQPGGVRLDLSAAAKGFAVDEAARWLLAQGVDGFLVNVGGELRAHGRKPDDEPWRVAIERPDAAAGAADARGETSRVLALRDMAVATSGDYRHFFDDAGHLYSHHIDPRSGQPVEHRLASVTVLAPTCMEADPIGTVLSVMGPDEGLAWARERDLAVRVLVRNADGGFTERMTPAFAALMGP